MAINVQLKQGALVPSKAPNLPIAPAEYTQQYLDQMLNALRLYFNQVDNFSGSVANDTGGKYIKFPFIAAYYYPAIYAAGNNTATIVTWNNTTGASGFVLNADNTATAQFTGYYKITYSMQLANSDNTAHDAIFWLRINGNDVPDSTTIFTVPARKSAGVNSYVGGYSEVVFYLNSGDSVGLWWGTDLAATAGGGLGVWIYSRAAQTSPMAYPATPSALGSITFVSAG